MEFGQMESEAHRESEREELNKEVSLSIIPKKINTTR